MPSKTLCLVQQLRSKRVVAEGLRHVLKSLSVTLGQVVGGTLNVCGKVLLQMGALKEARGWPSPRAQPQVYSKGSDAPLVIMPSPHSMHKKAPWLSDARTFLVIE